MSIELKNNEIIFNKIVKKWQYKLVWLGAFIILAIWGCWELIDWLWIDDAIRSTKPIVPEIELVIKNNVVDTVYVYRQP